MSDADDHDLKVWRQALEKEREANPHQPLVVMQLAAIYKAEGLFKEAQQCLRDLLSHDPNFAAAWNNLGGIYFAQKCWAEAQLAYENAIAQQADYIDAYYNLGLVLTKRHQFGKAWYVYQAVLDLDPNHVGASFQQALIDMQQQQYSQASVKLENLAERYPFHFETLVNLATCYLKLGQLPRARDDYTRALMIKPHDSQILFNLGVIAMQMDQPEEAIHHYLQVLTIDPDHYPAHNNISVAYLAVNDRQAALTHFREVLRLLPHDEAVSHTIAILSAESNLTQSPPAYIKALFDSYAGHYDQHMNQALHYQVPQWIAQAINTYVMSDDSQKIMLDIGCGTGLCAESLFSQSPYAQSMILDGVDLSEMMVACAREKSLYRYLEQVDIMTYLQTTGLRYDAVIAGDVIVYYGDLSELLIAVQRVLKPGGWFVFNAEINESDTYRLTATGRFAHSLSYLDDQIRQAGFTIENYQTITLREQNQQAVDGHFYVLRR